MAGVWAVAATAIAVIALLDSRDPEAREEAERARGRVAATELKLERRIDAIERRLDDLPRSEDVSKLQERLSRAETGTSKAAADARDAEKKLTDLSKRVKTMEDDLEGLDAADLDALP